MKADITIERVDATHVIARAGELGLSFTKSADGIERVRDIDVGHFIGQTDPRETRRLIQRWSCQTSTRKAVLHPEVLPTVGKTSGGRPGREFWLTLEETIFVVIKSETAKAIELTEFVIKVFAAVVRSWRRGPEVSGTVPETSVGLPLDSDEPAEAFERRAAHATAALDVALGHLVTRSDQDRAAVRETLRAGAATVAGVAGREWGQWTAAEHIAVLRALATIAATTVAASKRVAPMLVAPPRTRRRAASENPNQMTIFNRCTFIVGRAA